MLYRIHCQRLSTGEHMLTAYPTSGNDALHKTFSSWQDFRSAFSKYIDRSEIERLNSALANASFGIDIFEDRRQVEAAVLDSLGFT